MSVDVDVPMLVAGDVVTLGALPDDVVAKLSTAPYVVAPTEFVATAW